MKYLNKLASVFFIGALGVLTMTSCEGSDLYKVGAPDWLSEMGGEEEEPEQEDLGDQMEDVYTIGATDFSTGWWQQFTKYYVIPEATKWIAQFNLHINPEAPNTYKNYAMIISNDEDRGAENYKEYGVIRFDNQPFANQEGNSEWGDYIDRSLIESNLTFATNTDDGIQKLGGKVTLTVDRTEGGLIVKMTNGTVTKTYTQTSALVNLNADASNNNIRVCLCPEGSYIDWISTNIEPIGGCTSAEDKQPLSMVLKGVPAKVMVGTDQETLLAGVTAEVTFEELPAPVTVKAEDLQFEVIPNMADLGTKTLVAAYGKTFKGASATKPIIAYASFSVVDKMYTCIGKTDNTSAFREEKTEDFKVEPGQTYVNFFTNYTNGVENWNNFIITLTKASGAEYCFVRADNWGLGDSYWDGCQSCDWDWANFKTILDGAKVTTYITNNGDGTADVKAVVLGSDGKTYTQNYKGLKNIDPEDFYFNLSMEKAHLEFDYVIGAEDNTSAFRSVSTDFIGVPAGATMVNRFINYTDGAEFWNNFIITLYKADGTEYCFVRADNWGLGDSYWDGCQTCDWNWDAFKTNIDGALVTTYITNKGDGTADIKAVVLGSDGKTYTQKYTGLKNIDANDFGFKLSMEKAHLVFE